MFYGTVYIVFMWIWVGVTGMWQYTALDWSEPSSAGFYVATPALIIAGYTVCFSIAWVRERIVARMRRMS